MARILVADDDPTIRELLQCAFELEGYVVHTVNDGTAVLAALEEQPDPCILLLDVNMPVLDGLDLCAELSRQPLEVAMRTYVIIVTGERVWQWQCPPIVRAVFHKPFDLEALFALVARAADELESTNRGSSAMTRVAEPTYLASA